MVSIRTPWVFQDLVQELDRMTRDAGWAFGGTCAYPDSAMSGLTVEEDKAELALDLPGVRDGDLTIELEENRLKVEASRDDLHRDDEEVLLRERTYGDFRRVYRLPWAVREEDITATLVNGVLTLRLNRAPEASPRTIPVTTA